MARSCGGGGFDFVPCAPRTTVNRIPFWILLSLVLLCWYQQEAHAAAGGPNDVQTLEPDVWTNPLQCRPGGAWIDFSLNINSNELLGRNWLFEVEDLRPEDEGYKNEAISVHLFVDDVPPDRKSGVVATAAKNRLYTLEVSYYDIKLTNYFLGVRCGSEATTFRVLARSVVATLETGRPLLGEACEIQLVYHKFVVPSNVGAGFARVSVKASNEGSNVGQLRIKKHADTAPLRLVPPYDTFAPGEEGDVDICWLVLGQTHYVATKTAEGCTPYTLTLTFPEAGVVSEACSKKGAQKERRDVHEGIFPELEHNHFRYDTGVPFAYMDFRVHVGEADRDDNMVIFLEDLSTGAINPSAFALYLFSVNETIPGDRHTEYRSEYSVDGEYTITINKWDLKLGDYIVSVYTSNEAKSFRIVPYFIHSGIANGGHVAGFVCPGQFVFHYVNVGDDNNQDSHRRAGAGKAVAGAVDAVFEFSLLTGDVNYLTQHVYPPLKLSPPYEHADSADGSTNHTAKVCHAETGRQYIGLSGGEHCAEYEMYVNLIPAEDECKEVTHKCADEAECDVSCKPLWLNHFVYDSCTPGEYKDFLLNIDDKNAASNLIFEVENLDKRNLRPEALGIYIYKGNLPADRHSETKEEFSADGVWGIVVSEHDLKSGSYYLSVKCTGEQSVRFRVLALLSESNLHIGEPVHGEVAPGSWAHYHFEVPEASEVPYRVTFQLKLFTGDVKMRTTVDYPPIKLIPPYQVTEETEHRAGGAYEHIPIEISVCVPSGKIEYLGVLGGSHFASFQVSVGASPVMDLSECEGDLHRRRLAGGGGDGTDSSATTDKYSRMGSSVQIIEPEHFMKASCGPHEWVDFVLPSKSAQKDCNVVIEAEDLSRRLSTSGLGLFVYKERIPNDRVTEFKSTSTSDSHYTVTINAWDFDESTTYYASVRCGDQPKSFRLLVELVRGDVEEGTHATGFVCPGDFVYHFFDASAANRRAGGSSVIPAGSTNATNSMRTDVKFEIVLHGGAVAYKTMHNEPPLKLLPPYRTTSADSTFLYLCDVMEGRHYLGLLGMGECADYELYVHTMEHQDSCKEPVHDATARVGSVKVEELLPEHFSYGSCEPHETVDFVLHVSEAQSKTNLVLEVASLEEQLRMNALTVSLYEYEIPVDRHTEFRQQMAPEGIWTISRSYHDMHAGAYYLSVECGDVATSFRVLPLLIEAQLIPGGEFVHGEICPGDWVYHLVDTSDYISGGKLHESAHHVSLAFDIELHSGDLFYMLRPSDPPIRLVPPFRFAKLNGTDLQHFKACSQDIESHYHSKYYLALRGGEHCADYSITAHVYNARSNASRRAAAIAGSGGDEGCLEPFTHDVAVREHVGKSKTVDLIEGHFTYASCAPHSVSVYALTLPKTNPAEYYIFDVEDTSGIERVHSMHVVLAELIEEGEGHSDVIDQKDKSSSQIYRLALDASKVHAGATYLLTVQCHDDPLQYRVSATAVSDVRRRLQFDEHVPGQVSADSMTLHSILNEKDFVGDSSKNVKVRVTVRMFSGRIFMAMMRKSRPPGFSTMRKNYFHRDVEMEDSFSIDLCNPEPGSEYYIGLYGGMKSADYDIYAVRTLSADPCSIPDDDLGYVWKYAREPPDTNELSISGFGGSILGVLGIFLFFYAIAVIQESAERRRARKDKDMRASVGRVHVETVNHSHTNSNPTHGNSLNLSDSAMQYLAKIGDVDIEADNEGSDDEDAVLQELDYKFGEGKGKHMLLYAKKLGIRRNRAEAELNERSMRKMAYKALTLYLFITALFTVIVQLQRSIPMMNKLENTMRDFVTDIQTSDGVPFKELSTYEEVFDWLENGFLDSFFPEERWYNGDRVDDEETGFLVLYNKKLSGFVLKQRRVDINKGDVCVSSKRFRSFYPKCWGELSKATETRTSFGPSSDPMKYTYTNFKGRPGGFAVNFPLDRRQAIATARELQRDLFLDRQTRKLQLDVAVYNAGQRLFSIFSIQITIASTGSVGKSISFYTFPIELYVTAVDNFRGVLELSFACFVLASLAYEVFELIPIVHNGERWQIEVNAREYFTSPANYLDLTRQIFWQMSLVWFLRIINNQAAAHLKLPLPDGQIDSGLFEVAMMWRSYAQLNAVSMLVCLITVFRFLNLSPQYGTLVRTITRAAPSLTKFGLMFVLIFIFFSIMGQLMFGTALEEWSSVWSSSQVLFQMMTGEYGYGPLLEADPLMAPIFYYAYLVIVFFLLLNILLAILMDTYAIITEELMLADQRDKKRHTHSVMKEIAFEALAFGQSIGHSLSWAFVDRSLFSVGAYLTSERGIEMTREEGNEHMIRRAIKLEMEEMDEDLKAVQDEDGLEDLLTYDLLTDYYSEMSVVLLLLSVGDQLTKIYEESVRLVEPSKENGVGVSMGQLRKDTMRLEHAKAAIGARGGPYRHRDGHERGNEDDEMESQSERRGTTGLAGILQKRRTFNRSLTSREKSMKRREELSFEEHVIENASVEAADAHPSTAAADKQKLHGEKQQEHDKFLFQL